MAILKSLKDKIKGSGSTVKARPRSDEDVAKAVADYSAKKAEAMKKKLEDKKRERENKEKELEDVNKRLRTMKRTEESLEDRYERLAKKKRSELVDDYRKLITKLKLHPLVDGFDVDTKKRILVTTKPIKVKKKRWKKEKVAGIYQIRIDFSKENYSEGIQILNLTQRYKDYDSPVIASTRPCWGNIGPDIDAEFNSQDLYELIVDLVDYISSPNDKDGHLQWTESKDSNYKGGWEQFFSELKKQSKNYSFEKYDQDVKAGKIDGMADAVRVSGSGSSVSPSVSTAAPSLIINHSLESSESGAGLLYEANEALLGMGFRRDAANYFARLVFIEGARIPAELELRITHTRDAEGAVLYVARQGGGGVDRFLVNKFDIEVAVWERLIRGERFRYRLMSLNRMEAVPIPSDGMGGITEWTSTYTNIAEG